ncbi:MULTISPECIES: MBL fold metallo-hydrolase [Clostridium]|uniref:MBL fold metallo-hydrolase n=2 Tax=Clostridia TaxID=186801 RepID=A0A3R9DT38_CLOBU|nr:MULTISPECIES: MBL fold metallo-hydrolase [Clostridium]ETI91540.1 MAG: Metallo-beta-lactamase family protein [Clostridium butyricum DORA_1]MSA63321.1 MBL fold metallo-hydrolase [Gordonibacter pamelaeae]ALP88843.1 metallohydrolase [Clostridium butyricum]ALS18446.1 metallohydrolase [Clostridium butyricum]ANF15574.1 metallohydrolase [Clostridium butyricum]
MVFCSLYSGSSGNSMFITSDRAKILIDAGLPGKKIDEALKAIDEETKNIDGIFITHEHSDHIKGVGVISRKYDIPIYANADTWSAMEGSLGKIKEHNIKVIDKRSVTEIGDLNIKAFNIPHDASGPMGYTVSDGKKNISVATDFGTFTREIYDNVKDSEVILLESNHDVNMLKFGPYPYQLKRRILSEIGHLSNDDCGNAIVELVKCGNNKKIILGHLSNTNNQPDLAYATVLDVLNDNGIKNNEDIILTMANRHNPSSYIKI